MEINQSNETAPFPHNSLSYWQKTTVPIALSTALPSSSVVEVAVIGGGILGTATCYWLARAGVSVVLLERSMLASEATGRNGGIVSIGPALSYPDAIAKWGHASARQVLMLTLESKALLQRIIGEEEIACDYREPGRLALALASDHMEHLRQSVAALQADGVSARLLSRQEVQEQVRTPLGQEIIGGQLTEEVGLVHSSRLVHGLAHAAQRYGARLYAANVLQLAPDRGSVHISTTNGSLHAKHVIIAANAGIGRLIPAVARLITPVRGQVLAYAPCKPVFTTSMAVNITPTGEYWQQNVDGTIVLGGYRAIAPRSDVGIESNHPTPEVQAALEQVLPQLFPSLSGLQVVQRWAGVMAFTPDALPIIDQVNDIPGAWIAGGFSGHGMVFAAQLGQLLSETITSRRIPAALSPFRLNRETLI